MIMNILMFALVVGLLVSSVVTRHRELSLSTGWVEIVARIASSRRIVNGEDITIFIELSYVFDGKEYFVENLTIEGVERISLDKGMPVVVLVDPACPQRCMIKRASAMDNAFKAILKA